VSVDRPADPEPSTAVTQVVAAEEPSAPAERFRVDCAACGWLLSDRPTAVFERAAAYRRAGAHEAERAAGHDCAVSRVPAGPGEGSR